VKPNPKDTINFVRFSWLNDFEQPYNLSHDNLIIEIKRRIFFEVKSKYFWELLSATVTRTLKTEDDYDYPEDLPQVKINRIKSFRTREASEKLKISGEEFLYSSMFCQLWKELRQHSEDKLKINYTHPMDDGQSRAFKIRFEGEGVDDYGGPYREVFQQLCDELQFSDPSTKEDSSHDNNKHETPDKCFLPILHPSANWNATECSEKYKYVFKSSNISALKLDLYCFLGEIVGIAVRSKITLDLNFSSIVWKFVVGERISDLDLASFDVAASEFIKHLSYLYTSLSVQKQEKVARKTNAGEWGAEDASNAESSIDQAIYTLEEEIKLIIQDLYWTARTCEGEQIELIENGSKINVTLEDLPQYLQTYVECRIYEFYPAICAFRNGILNVLPETAVCLLNWEEFEAIVCGSKTIDVERLKINTEYDDDVKATDPHIVAFWEVLSEFTEEEKSQFLRFVWARPTLPPKGVDFPQKMNIQTSVEANSKPDNYLPKAHTCFFSLNLPNYSSKQVTKSLFILIIIML
jgi:hypothetical protein